MWGVFRFKQGLGGKEICTLGGVGLSGQTIVLLGVYKGAAADSGCDAPLGKTAHCGCGGDVACCVKRKPVTELVEVTGL